MTDNAMSPAAVDAERYEMEKAKGDDFATVWEALEYVRRDRDGQYHAGCKALSRIEAENRKLREALKLAHEFIDETAVEIENERKDGHREWIVPVAKTTVYNDMLDKALAATRAALDGG
jgi:hypothetical protein